ncbi:hypothetical protein [Candidatus Lokiarchaeum ossiferum]|uniref:hypothetical protein n=1 Tax=Candidatus Lokiarchaeum ossiferum TaxID=2951803 RepID=UPI00352D24B3
MSPVTIKSANPDDIWDRWKKKAVKSQKLEKHYGVKGAVFNLDNITAAEFVKGVTKAAIVFFEKSYEVKVQNIAPKKEKGDVRDIEKMKFYQFKSNPVKTEWKGDEEVPFAATLTKENCSKCTGKGGVVCKKCNGTKLVICPDCNNKAKSCKSCEGTGKYMIEVKVLDEKNNKTTKKIEVKCNECYGTGKLTCTRCGGMGKIACKNCNATGFNSCSECRGHGSLFTYQIKPVPFKHESSAEPILLSSIKLSGLEKELGKEIQKTIEQVEGILIRNPEKELDQKFIEPNLGYYSKEIGKISKEAAKEIKNSKKNKDIKIKMPLFLFPVLALDCETKKGKKFQVYSIGSDNKFQVFGRI